jgi:predicted ATP-dependent serine protease
VEPRKTLYVSGEESVVQLAFACQRLGLPHVEVCNNQEINGIVDHIVDYDMIVIDSFQCLRHANLTGRRLEIYAVNALTAAAKEAGGVVGIIMHMTKDGKLKGNTMVPHTVDMTMYVAHADAEVYGPNVRCIYTEKNRFGRTGELFLRMTSKGYDLANPIAPVTEADGFTHKLFGSMLKQLDKVMITVDHLESVAHGARVPLKRLLGMMSILEAHNNVRVHGKGKNRVWTWN